MTPWPRIYRELRRMQREAARVSLSASSGAYRAGSVGAPLPAMNPGWKKERRVRFYPPMAMFFFTMTTDGLAHMHAAFAPFPDNARYVRVRGLLSFEKALASCVCVHARCMRTSVTEVHRAISAGKVELGDSVRYREGMGEAEAFAHFTEWVMRSPHPVLRDRIIRPIPAR